MMLHNCCWNMVPKGNERGAGVENYITDTWNLQARTTV